jgi:DNA-directed RNA polymerase specialized sigma24 family protein
LSDAGDNPLERIKWAEVWMRLRTIAGWLTHGKPDIFDAVSTEDLVNETILDFLRSPDGLGWVPERGSLDAYLATILKRRFIDHLRRHNRNGGPVEETALFAAEPGHELEQQEAVAQVLKQVQGDTELEELVVAVVESEAGSRLNQELADDLHVSVTEVVNRRKACSPLLREASAATC